MGVVDTDGGLEIWHIIWYGGIGLEMEGAIPFTNCDKCNLQGVQKFLRISHGDENAM